MWRGVLNIPEDEFWNMPIGEMNDIIACYQIANGAEEKIIQDPEDDEDEDWIFPDLA